jgi:steroid delta-isomerase-like uncharacterized protein
MKNTIYSAILCGLVVTLVSCSGGSEQKHEMTQSADQHKANVEAVYNMMSSGKTEGIENYIAADFVDRTPPPNMQVNGPEGFKNLINMYHEGFPDSKMEILNYTEKGDLVYVHFNLKGTNSGPMMGMPATNKSVDANGVDILRFANGKCVEHWGYFEEAKYMTQLGMLPEMPPPAQAPAETK